jgi:hypothetical protein
MSIPQILEADLPDAFLIEHHRMRCDGLAPRHRLDCPQVVTCPPAELGGEFALDAGAVFEEDRRFDGQMYGTGRANTAASPEN